METLTRTLIDQGLTEQVLTEKQLARLLRGTDQRRYNLVNRALHAQELWRLRRGRYLLSPVVSGYRPHPFVIVQSLHPGAYVSFEAALSHHGWIPESTPLVQAVTPGRRRDLVTVTGVGEFRFYPLALNPGGFLRGVERSVLSGHPALVARPLRALLDLLCLRKEEWPGETALLQGLRIDEQAWKSVDVSEMDALRAVYNHRRMQRLIDALQKDLADD